jgi:hypothetical protein
MQRTFFITDTNKEFLIEQIKNSEVGDVVEIKPPTRTLDQNALLWPYLVALSKNLEWPVLVNGQFKMEKMSDLDWKDTMTGSFEGEARRMAQGTDGTGLVMLGSRTSKYGKKKFSEFIEFVMEFCARHNVEPRFRR